MSGHPQQIDGIHILTGEPIRLWIDAMGQIAKTERLTLQPNNKLDWLAPGLVDLQINGHGGIDLNTPALTVQAVKDITRKLWLEGVTTFCPTIITNNDDAIEQMVRTIAEAYSSDPLIARSIAGIHLEGPFISPEDGARGAHGKQYVKAPDWELFQRWQHAAGGLIRIVTLSPEWDGAYEFIEKCARSGVIVSIGHTAASPEQIGRAVAAGARMSTHLGNGAHLWLPRHPNYIWEQLAQEALWTCAIADGFHLPASVLKVFMKAKGEQLMLVSDAVYLSGLAAGEYETHIGGTVVLSPEGRLHMADNPGLLAGSAQMLTFGIDYLVRSGLCTEGHAWEMASIRPARFMDLPVQHGLSVGAPADLVLYNRQDGRISMQTVIKNGHRVECGDPG
ncbi:N-acetylglucosamine-6-phosphate deacetylase [Paenibacillus piri]|uniref:N-acetylglucosamine-6-phosphate deacetylase n=1 Tax=Paenibacillus piri TaxID=2547395 RepID=A0A4R5KXD5_9BACL|nr:amidohydrolase family protein [Paenibacillus piri]TDG00243.1 N-acetylglucosamine-6-phosphate deacetylase [Paenibacillus piri]